MNLPIVLLGAIITGVGFFTTIPKKELTTDKNGSKTSNTDHAKSVPDKKHDEKLKFNKNDLDTSGGGDSNLDDLADDPKPE